MYNLLKEFNEFFLQKRLQEQEAQVSNYQKRVEALERQAKERVVQKEGHGESVKEVRKDSQEEDRNNNFQNRHQNNFRSKSIS